MPETAGPVPAPEAHHHSPDTRSPQAATPPVGVLGGMGPAATADFYAKLIRATPATRDQEHLRVVIWSDPSTPDRTQALLQDGPDPTPWLVHGARMLTNAGADLIAVPCNTAHAFLPAVADRVGVPIVHMIDQASRRIASMNPRVRTAGLIATTGTVQAGLYQEWLTKAGIELLVPHPPAQAEEVMPAIRAIKAGTTVPGTLAAVARRLLERGAEVIIAGCTEVPLGLHPDELPVPLVDPAQVLAEAVVARISQAQDHD